MINVLIRWWKHVSFPSRINDLQIQERRNRQFFESQVKELKEKKLRKQADEKASVIRCPESCKIKKMQLEGENNKLRREIMLMEETKQNLEKLLYEQNLEVNIYWQKIVFKHQDLNLDFSASKVR